MNPEQIYPRNLKVAVGASILIIALMLTYVVLVFFLGPDGLASAKPLLAVGVAAALAIGLGGAFFSVSLLFRANGFLRVIGALTLLTSLYALVCCAMCFHPAIRLP